jgi:mRNA interferase RelE/StbE
MKHWEIKILSHAKAQMREIKDRRIQEKLVIALRRLEYAPEQQGKRLGEELVDYYSVRAVSQRYRIIYHVREDVNFIFVFSIGIRREGDKNDIYTQTKKFLRQGLFHLNIEIENILDAHKENLPLTVTPIELASSAETCPLSEAESLPTTLQDQEKHDDS